MKKLLIILLALSMIFAMCSCNYFERAELLEKYKAIVDTLGKSQLTSDKLLSGARQYGEDCYTGFYSAHCSEREGREVIFGGASIDERTIYISGWIITDSGRAQLRVRQNDCVYIINPNDCGFFSSALNLESGGNFIMFEFEDFTGTICFTSSYEQTKAL